MPSGRVLALAVAVSTGCGYTSSYVAPDAWRARPVYHRGKIVHVGPTELPKCAWELPPGTGGAGSPPPIWDGRGWSRGGGRVGVFVFAGPSNLGTVPSPGLFSGGGGGGGGGNAQGAGALLLILGVAALAASSIVAVALAATPVESESNVTKTLDGVNGYNDHARAKMLQCFRDAPTVAPTPGPAPLGATAPPQEGW